MVTVRCDYKKCGKSFNKTPLKVKRDRHHFCSRECAQKFREENEQEWSPHIMNKRPHQIIRGFLAVRNIHHLNDFDVSRKVFR